MVSRVTGAGSLATRSRTSLMLPPKIGPAGIALIIPEEYQRKASAAECPVRGQNRSRKRVGPLASTNPPAERPILRRRAFWYTAPVPTRFTDYIPGVTAVDLPRMN